MLGWVSMDVYGEFANETWTIFCGWTISGASISNYYILLSHCRVDKDASDFYDKWHLLCTVR